jgi:hypothetical protein
MPEECAELLPAADLERLPNPAIYKSRFLQLRFHG